MNSSQYRELKGLLNTIQETLDGKGREPGLKQELRELRHYVEGRPPGYDDGIRYALKLLGNNHTTLREEFDSHVEKQREEGVLHQGKRSGLSELWKVILTIVGFLATVAGLYLAIQQAVANALGGG